MLKEFEKRLLSSLILIPIAIFFIIQGSVFFIFFLSLFFLATSYEWIKMTKQNNFMKIFGIIFLFFSFLTAFYVRGQSGLNFFLFIKPCLANFRNIAPHSCNFFPSSSVLSPF